MRSQVWRYWDGFFWIVSRKQVNFVVLLVQLGLVGLNRVSRMSKVRVRIRVSVKLRVSDRVENGDRNRTFRRGWSGVTSELHASPCLWNQLPSSLRQPHSSHSVSDFPAPAPATSYSFNSPLSPSITPSLFHSRLKTYVFHISFLWWHVSATLFFSATTHYFFSKNIVLCAMCATQYFFEKYVLWGLWHKK